MWADRAVFYQIYPLGFCGARSENDGVPASRIRKVMDWIPHLTRLGVDAVYFCPVFEADRHGYDTRDYRVIDCRLGTNEDFAEVCGALHQAGIRVALDGVFNHVGRGFFAFQDLLRNREQSAYRDWFLVDFGRDSSYGDGFWYEGWEGHYELAKLNLRNPEVSAHLLSCVRGWAAEFGIDGLRLDVAYCLDREFLSRLRSFCDELGRELGRELFLVGETLHGDYNQLVNDSALHSCTNYECYKGIHSSFNDLNLFEIAHSLNRQFGPEDWTLYKGKHLLCFCDNHDVTRLATVLKDPRHLEAAYGLLFAMPGIPCVYYGSEWGAEGDKVDGSDAGLRPCFEQPVENHLTELIGRLSKVHRESAALCFGSYRTVVLTNRQLIFERRFDGDEHQPPETVLCAINADQVPFTADLSGYLWDRGVRWDQVECLVSDGQVGADPGQLELPAFGVNYYRLNGCG